MIHPSCAKFAPARPIMSPAAWAVFLIIAYLLLAASERVNAQVPPFVLKKSLIPAPEIQAGAQFGRGICAEGNYIVVGAPQDDTYGNDAGLAKVYHAGTGALLYDLIDPSPASFEAFGYSVAISGTRVAVGIVQDSTGASYAGMVRVYDLGSATPTVPIHTILNPTPGVFDGFGWSVSLSGSTLVVGGPADDTNATDAGSAYVYDLGGATPTTPLVTLNDPAATANDQFGLSVAVSGTRVVVGAKFDDTGFSNSGKAYVYDMAGGSPTIPSVILPNPTPAANDYFGTSVTISGTTVIVGAISDDTAKTDAGSAYVYDISSGTPTVPVHTVSNPATGGASSFGATLSIMGTQLLVGAPNNSAPTANVAGAAYLYDLASGTPTVATRTFLNPTPVSGEYFGSGVVLFGTKALIATPLDDLVAADAGAAYLYDLNSGTPTTPAHTFNDPSPEMENRFGQTVSVSGSLVAVGVPNDANASVATNIGTVYVYDTASATPAVPAFTLSSPVNSGTIFGNSVSISGTRVVVGAPYDFTGAGTAGIIYVYDLSSGTPTVPALIIPNPEPAQSDNFGNTVAISGTRIVVGALYDDAGQTDAGSAYVFDLSSGTPTAPVAILHNPTPANGDAFGHAVAISGSRVVVGCKEGDIGFSNAGIAYVYDMSSGTPTVPVVTLNNPDPASGDQFGTAVTIDGSTVAVSAAFEDTGASNTGTVYVYDVSSGTPTVPTRTINNPSPAASDSFGAALAISGAHLVITTTGDDTGASNAGNAYVYNLGGATPAVPVATLLSPMPAASDSFGSAVSISGTTITIGVPYSDVSARDQGAVYVFAPPSTDANLSALSLSAGNLLPAFAAGTTTYSAAIPFGTSSITVTPTKAEAGATITVNGSAVASGSTSGSIAISIGNNPITIVVTAEDGVTTKTYNVTASLPGSGTLAFASSVFTVASGGNATQADITILRTVSSAGPVSCQLNSADGTAISPDQFAAQTNAAVVLADGVSEQHVLIPIAANATTTVAKVFSVTLGNVSGGADLGSPVTAFVVILPPAAATDNVKPAVTITAPVKNSTIVDTVPVTISGTATDNIGVSKVQVSINNGLTYTDAMLANLGGTTTAYSIDLQPLPGINSLKVRSLDFKGNVSAMAAQTFTHLRTLTVGIIGPALSGTVSTGFAPTSLRQAGKIYSITATAKTGFVFDGWDVVNAAGSGITAASTELPKLDFIMQPGLGLTAKFIIDPFKPAVTGDFSGLIMPSGSAPAGGTVASHATVGFCSAKLTPKASLTGSLKVDGLTLPFTALCDNTGVARFGKTRAKTLTLARPGKPSLTLALKVDLTGATKQLTGTVTELYRGDTLAESNITASRHAYDGKTSSVPAQYVKLYTARLKARASQGAGFTSQDYPQGDGYVTFQIKANGTVTMAGKLADDTPVMSSSSLSQTNHWPIFQQLYKNKGCIAADAVMDDTQADTDAAAMNMMWFRPFQETQWYPYGWNEGILVDMLASKYTPPPASVFTGLGAVDPNLGNTDLTFTQGLLANTIIKYVNLTTDNKLTTAPASDKNFTFKPAFATGLISGTFTYTNNMKSAWQGVLMQKGANKGGHGYFMSVKPATLNYLGESGKVNWSAK
ncbi:MAG: cadherin-like beta sandwich domain-containing protein [Verrucomicrobiota bacterium]